MTFQERMGIPQECEMAAMIIAPTLKEAKNLAAILGKSKDDIILIDNGETTYYGFKIKTEKFKISIQITKESNYREAREK